MFAQRLGRTHVGGARSAAEWGRFVRTRRRARRAPLALWTRGRSACAGVDGLAVWARRQRPNRSRSRRHVGVHVALLRAGIAQVDDLSLRASSKQSNNRFSCHTRATLKLNVSNIVGLSGGCRRRRSPAHVANSLVSCGCSLSSLGCFACFLEKKQGPCAGDFCCHSECASAPPYLIIKHLIAEDQLLSSVCRFQRSLTPQLEQYIQISFTQIFKALFCM